MRTLRLALLLAAAALPAGCSTGARPAGMVPGGPPDPAALPAWEVEALARRPTLSIRVTGGETTNPLHTSEISDAAFREALAWAVLRSGAFLPVFDRPADYRLHVDLRRVEQPFWGWLDMTVEVVADWRLADARSGELVWTDRLRSRFTATGEDSSLGIRRLRMANEGSARRNIDMGVRELAARAPATASAETPAPPP